MATESVSGFIQLQIIAKTRKEPVYATGTAQALFPAAPAPSAWLVAQGLAASVRKGIVPSWRKSLDLILC